MGNTHKIEAIHFSYGFYSLWELGVNTSIKKELKNTEVILFAERKEIFLGMGYEIIAIIFFLHLQSLKAQGPLCNIEKSSRLRKMSHRILRTID